MRWTAVAGYIDKTGRLAIQPQFDDAKPFSPDLAPVEIGFRAGLCEPRRQETCGLDMAALRKIKFGWKHRRPLWKYRKFLRHRRAIAGWATAAAAIGAGILNSPRRIEWLSAQHG
jgi:hypothetical protein